MFALIHTTVQYKHLTTFNVGDYSIQMLTYTLATVGVAIKLVAVEI